MGQLDLGRGQCVAAQVGGQLFGHFGAQFGGRFGQKPSDINGGEGGSHEDLAGGSDGASVASTCEQPVNVWRMIRQIGSKRHEIVRHHLPQHLPCVAVALGATALPGWSGRCRLQGGIAAKFWTTGVSPRSRFHRDGPPQSSTLNYFLGCAVSGACRAMLKVCVLILSASPSRVKELVQ